MRLITTLACAIGLLNTSAVVDAGLFDFGRGKQQLSCAEDCQTACRPRIARPSWINIFSHQRKSSNCCDTGGCTIGSNASCCAPDGCAPICESTCCAPAACSCSACCGEGGLCSPNGCGDLLTGCFNPNCHHDGCCSPATKCEVAELIAESKTACYARHRRSAIHKLGDHYDCCCHPEIMNAFICALNDSDERVRAKAADEIGDQMRRNRCICGAPVIRALKFSLADCDRHVRRQAEEALQLCGYDIVDGCCQGQYCAAPCDSCAAQPSVAPFATPSMSDELLPADGMNSPMPVPESSMPPATPDVPQSEAEAADEPTVTTLQHFFTGQVHEIQQVSADCGLATAVE
ncbi:HEAT repeat domain-containing protein [Fuerstiella marisgermanici]|uniref:Uncharacterized protein n=1 Tax=Fuerstiella marisgermanici TaxID=1891926 RepID=A0A1P8WN71_9PLAN|nr:HEAT repeat domain-containing protein [Fuerstiella marisgermanici]APZ95495.1 hypothetical protein Fuma_05153 [Fuerstiella marisgermanici]